MSPACDTLLPHQGIPAHTDCSRLAAGGMLASLQHVLHGACTVSVPQEYGAALKVTKMEADPNPALVEEYKVCCAAVRYCCMVLLR